MSNLSNLIDHMRRLLGEDAFLQSRGLSKRSMYRAYFPQIKDPAVPCITVTSVAEPSIRQAKIKSVHLYFTLYTKEYKDVEDVIDYISDLLDGYKAETDDTVLYGCFTTDENQYGLSRTVPTFDQKSNLWEGTLEVRCEVG